MKIQAKHKILSFMDCQNTDLSKEAFENAVALTGATIISTLEHNFEPQGKSILTLLSESHASFHSYPEYDFCYLDIFTCGDMNINAFEKALRKILKPQQTKARVYNRSY